MLKDNNTWELFSNHGYNPDQAHANSLESVHDHIHVAIGYGEERGHMTHPYWAGEDFPFLMNEFLFKGVCGCEFQHSIRSSGSIMRMLTAFYPSGKP